MIPASAPPRVHAHLRAAADGPVPVVHAGRDAVYVDVAGRCVGVVGPRAVAVPCALRTRVEHLDVRSAGVRGGVLHLDGEPVVVGRMVGVAGPRLPAAVRRQPAPSAPSAPPAPPAPAPVTAEDVEHMVGRGDGLTPYDDDVLCGWLALHRAAGVPTPEVDAAVRACLDRTTLLSATLLDCALHGEVVPEFASWVAALGTVTEPDRAAALAALGHSSGRGLLHGGRTALAHLSSPHTEGVA